MAYFEYRKLNFFDLIPDVDDGKISLALKNSRITATSTGFEYLVIGDSSGFIHLVDKNFSIQSFRAYELNVDLIKQSKQSAVVISIGEDDEVVLNPIIKVWSINKTTKQGTPTCLRVLKPSVPNKAVIPTCMAVNDTLTLMSVGFSDGCIFLYRGDLVRDRNIKLKIINEDQLTSISGLAFYMHNRLCHLYVSTVSSVEMFDMTHEDVEVRTHIDNVGCSLKCSLLAESSTNQDCNFIVASKEAVFFYTNGVKGACHVIGGDKIQISWYRNYLVILSKEEIRLNSRVMTASSKLSDSKDAPIVSVLDINNKIMAFTTSLPDVSSLVEWGSIYALSTKNSLSLISEIDLQSKMTLLFKKNLYDVGIRMAKQQHYDTEDLMEMFKQYADNLYKNGDHKSAIEQYIETIGYLEPSYVIRKYRTSQKVDMLPVYLEALHRQGKANEDYTTLLLNCYRKLNKPDLLRKFILSKDSDVKFDVNVAIDVCRYVCLEDALTLAELHHYHEAYLAMQIDDLKNYQTALKYISNLPFAQAEALTMKYCPVFLQNIPHETTEFLKTLCSGYQPKGSETDEQLSNGNSESSLPKSEASNFVHFFLNYSEHLVDFLSFIMEKEGVSSAVVSTLLEHYLTLWRDSRNADEQQSYSKVIIEMLQSRDSSYDRLHALVLCKEAGFSEGLLYLYKQQNMYELILKHHMDRHDHDAALQTCRVLGDKMPRLWIQALWGVAKKEKLPNNIIQEILSVIEEKKLLAPSVVLEALRPSFSVGSIRNYFNKIYSDEVGIKTKEQNLIDEYTEKLRNIEKCLDDMKYRPIVFQSSKCATCDKHLCLPSVHFLCQHSYHQKCLQSFSDSEDECPVCRTKNKALLEAINARGRTKGMAEDFHSQLDHADDCFTLVTKYLVKGVFKNSPNISEVAMRAAGIIPSIPLDHDVNLHIYDTPGASDEAPLQKGLEQSAGESVLSNLVSTKHEKDTAKMDISSAVVPGNPFLQGNPFASSSGNPYDDYDDDDDDDADDEDDDDDDEIFDESNPFSNSSKSRI